MPTDPDGSDIPFLCESWHGSPGAGPIRKVDLDPGLEGKDCAVFGGSRGIGRCITRALVAEGANASRSKMPNIAGCDQSFIGSEHIENRVSVLAHDDEVHLFRKSLIPAGLLPLHFPGEPHVQSHACGQGHFLVGKHGCRCALYARGKRIFSAHIQLAAPEADPDGAGIESPERTRGQRESAVG